MKIQKGEPPAFIETIEVIRTTKGCKVSTVRCRYKTVLIDCEEIAKRPKE